MRCKCDFYISNLSALKCSNTFSLHNDTKQINASVVYSVGRSTSILDFKLMISSRILT